MVILDSITSETFITRKVELQETTRQDDFHLEFSRALTHALTMGMQTILNAKTIYFMAFNESKKDIVKTAFTGEITTDVPASLLQTHPNCYVCLDQYTQLIHKINKMKLFNTKGKVYELYTR